jgi:membrane-bound lytic murein transglycosylase A
MVRSISPAQPHRARRAAAGLAPVAASLLLAACGLLTPPPAPGPAPSTPPPGPAAKAAEGSPNELLRPRARWLRADWGDLPGWEADALRELWPALAAGCAKPAEGWATACRQLLATNPATDAEARAALQRWLQPYRVESLEGQVQGLATGYFEPLVQAMRLPRYGYQVPVYRVPPDLGTRKPYWTRKDIDTLPEAKASLRGHEIAYVASPMDVLVLQVQGSGRLRVTEPDGKERNTRLAYAGHNDHPYKSVGRWLIDNGEMKPEEANWLAIRDWARRNPERMNTMLWSNPRVVFFREEALPDEGLGPRGAQGVPLTPQRSVAVDPQAVPYGTPLWIDTTEPLGASPLRRAVMAQDTGSAIQGAVRVDYFWGWGWQAEQSAGRMKQPLKVWALWPK